jgi:hypothetical protein
VVLGLVPLLTSGLNSGGGKARGGVGFKSETHLDDSMGAAQITNTLFIPVPCTMDIPRVAFQMVDTTDHLMSCQMCVLPN